MVVSSETQTIENKGNKTKRFEGFRRKIYFDTTGNRTIGYGFNIDDKSVSSLLSNDIIIGKRLITKNEADNVFQNLYNRAENDAKIFIGEKEFDSLSLDKQEVITDMAYNMGLPKLLEFRKFRKFVRNKDFYNASKELIDSKWFEQVGNRSRHHVRIFNSDAKINF